MSNLEERPWWSQPEKGHMFTPGANERVANALMVFDNALSMAPVSLMEALSNIAEDHPEVRDTDVREFIGEALEEIVIDFTEMMMGDDECEPGFNPEP